MFLRPLAAALLALSIPAYAADPAPTPSIPAPTPAPTPAPAPTPTPALAHRALYELKLENRRGSDINGATGSLAYELVDACDGWATRQRLRLLLNSRDGQEIEMISDYATFESKDGLSMTFRMKQTTDGAVIEQAEGTAKLDAAGGPGTIRYTVPEERTEAMPAGTVFPMRHTEAIIAAAEEGKKFIALPIFDGTGTKGAQDSSVVVIDWNKGAAAAPFPVLADLPNGRVRIAFFDRSKTPGSTDKPVGAPDYEVGMRYWANGVADDLHMDFGDFVMGGSLKELVPEKPHC